MSSQRVFLFQLQDAWLRRIHFHCPQNKVASVHLPTPFALEKDSLGLLRNDGEGVPHPRNEMIPSGESRVRILKAGI